MYETTFWHRVVRPQPQPTHREELLFLQSIMSLSVRERELLLVRFAAWLVVERRAEQDARHLHELAPLTSVQPPVKLQP
jgi:hypothetical protein